MSWYWFAEGRSDTVVIARRSGRTASVRQVVVVDVAVNHPKA